MKVVSVVGNRPQFIKAAPLSRALAEVCDHVLVHTGQHYDEDLSQVFFEELGMALPDHRIETGSGSHAQHGRGDCRRARPHLTRRRSSGSRTVLPVRSRCSSSGSTTRRLVASA